MILGQDLLVHPKTRFLKQSARLKKLRMPFLNVKLHLNCHNDRELIPKSLPTCGFATSLFCKTITSLGKIFVSELIHGQEN